MKTKPCRKGKPKKSRNKPRKTSTVPCEITSEGWTLYPESLQQLVELQPLEGLAEALGLECHIILQAPKSKSSSKEKR